MPLCTHSYTKSHRFKKKNIILASSLLSAPLINVVSAGVFLYPQIAQSLTDASMGVGFIHDGSS